MMKQFLCAFAVMLTIAVVLYIFAYWSQYPEMSQMEVFQHTWPLLLAAACVDVAFLMLAQAEDE